MASLGQLRYISLMNRAYAGRPGTLSGIDMRQVAECTQRRHRRPPEGAANAPKPEGAYGVEPNAVRDGAAIAQAMQRGRQPTVSPYGDGESSWRTAAAIAAIPDFRALLKKGFHDLPVGEAAR